MREMPRESLADELKNAVMELVKVKCRRWGGAEQLEMERKRVNKEREERMKGAFYLMKRTGWQKRVVEIRDFGKGAEGEAGVRRALKGRGDDKGREMRD